MHDDEVGDECFEYSGHDQDASEVGDHMQGSTGSWMTVAKELSITAMVLLSIDLDPASCHSASSTRR